MRPEEIAQRQFQRHFRDRKLESKLLSTLFIFLRIIFLELFGKNQESSQMFILSHTVPLKENHTQCPDESKFNGL